jgi:cysteine-rich repeat protein
MRKLPLAVTSMLLVLACGDDGLTQDPSESSSSGEADSTSTGPAVTSTTVEPTGSTSDATTTGLDSTTAPAVECGNGIVEAGEECDDENVLDDDDCSSVCTIPFEELWTVTYDGGDDDVANHVLFDDEGNVYVLGNSQIPGQGYDVWLRQYTPDGREGWTWTYDGAFGGDDFGRRIAWFEGDLVILGTEATETNGDDVLLIRLSPADQSLVWTQQYSGPGSGLEPGGNDDFGAGVAVDADGNLLVAATLSVDGQEVDISLRKLDPEGAEIWTHEYDDPTLHGDDVASAVVVDGTDAYLIGNSQIATTTDQSWVRKLDTDGNELWTQTIPGVEFTNGALDSAGNLVLAGLEDDNPDNVNLWIGKYDPDFAELGTTAYDGPSGSFDVGLGVAAGASGDVYASGQITVVGQQAEIWAGRYMADLGLRLWSDSYGNAEAQLFDVGRSVAVSADESRVVVVGYESVLGQDANVWVRMYQNNPAPGQ